MFSSIRGDMLDELLIGPGYFFVQLDKLEVLFAQFALVFGIYGRWEIDFIFSLNFIFFLKLLIAVF